MLFILRIQVKFELHRLRLLVLVLNYLAPWCVFNCTVSKLWAINVSSRVCLREELQFWDDSGAILRHKAETEEEEKLLNVYEASSELVNLKV